MQRAGTTSRATIPVFAAAACGVLIGIALTASAPISGIAGTGEVVSAAVPAVRALLDLAAVTTVGLCLLPVLLGPLDRERPNLVAPVTRLAARAACASALVWVVCGLVTLVLQAAAARPGGEGLTFADITVYVSGFAAGKALVAVIVLALGIVGVTAHALLRGHQPAPELLVGMGLFALLPVPVTGHAAGGELANYLMISIALHVASMATWVGGLGALALLLAGNRTLLAHALPRYSRLATICLALTALTGLLNGLVPVASSAGLPAGLWETPYGLLVVLKTACLAGITATGTRLRWRLLPRIMRHERTALLGWATLELTIMGLAIGLAAVLSRTPLT